VRRKKASAPAADLANEGRAVSKAGELKSRDAKLSRRPCLAVYAGQTCIGFLLLRGKTGVEAFDAADKSLGIFPDQKSAADAVSARAAS
jgi:hypothetical protein